MIQDLSGSWCIKGTVESVARVDSPVPLMPHDPDRSWISDPNSDHPKGTHSPVPLMHHDPDRSWITDLNSDHPKGTHPSSSLSSSSQSSPAACAAVTNASSQSVHFRLHEGVNIVSGFLLKGVVVILLSAALVK